MSENFYKYKYTSIVAIMDGFKDSAGDILSENVTFPHIVPVYPSYDKCAVFGVAKLTQIGHTIVADLDLCLDSDVATKLKGALVGRVLAREGGLITSWELTNLMLSPTNADSRIPFLRVRK